MGFKKIFTLNKEIKAVGHGYENRKDIENSMAFGKDVNQLISLVKNGATSVAITDAYIDKKLMETIKNEKCILCMPMSIITASYGIQRSHNIYKMGKLFAYARKKGIEVCFASLAGDSSGINSYMQLIELAKLVGSDDKYARYSLSQITKSIAIA
ncbi:MAG: hypothetical protein ACHQX1_00035 [Candidatus Micrarchaeales archaeon]